MRKEFAKWLLAEMAKNKNIFFVTADLGFKLWDEIRDTYPDRFYNVGASEMAGMLICVGLALEGRIPILYSISPFAIYRPFEVIHLYLDGEQIPVKILGGGRDKDYHIDGPSHDATNIKGILNRFRIEQFYPEMEGMFKEDLNDVFKEFLYNKKPSYLSLRK